MKKIFLSLKRAKNIVNKLHLSVPFCLFLVFKKTRIAIAQYFLHFLLQFTIKMIEEDDFDEIYSEPERISLKFHEMLACINEDTDNSSAISDDIDFEDFNNFEEEINEQEICNERD